MAVKKTQAKNAKRTQAAAKKTPAKAAKKTSAKGAKKAPARRGTAQSAPVAHDHDEHEHVEFRLSKKTAGAIDTALKGLNSRQQERVLEAIDRVGEEAGEKVGRWVEDNVVANANELFALMAPDLAGRSRWDEIRAIYTFLDNLDVAVDHGRTVKEIEKGHGGELAKQYRVEMGIKWK